MINSPFGVGLALAISRLTPPAVGYRIGSFLAGRIATRRYLPMVAAVRSNQQVVHQGRLSVAQLDEITLATFRHTSRCLYDLYHNLSNPKAAQKFMRYTPEAEKLFAPIPPHQKGRILVGIHMSNFDYIIHAAGMRGLQIVILGAAQPGKGYQIQNDLRRKAGVELIPASTTALRQALRHLQAGGTIATGIDRPVPAPKIRPRFFGRPAALPTHHIYLALKACVPIVVVSARMCPDGIYEMVASEPFEMQRCAERYDEIKVNAEKVLEIAEPFILQAPYQWSMFYPVWPEEQLA